MDMNNFKDQFANETNHGNQKVIDEHGFPGSDRAESDGLTIDPINWSKREIELQKPMLIAMAKENKSEPPEDTCLDLVFDEALCDVAEISLRTEGLDNPSDLSKIKALMIHAARDFNSVDELASHLDAYSSAEIDRLGLEYAYSASTYRKKIRSLKKEDRYESVRNATFIGVHALWWMGVRLRDSTMEKYDISYDLDADASNFKNGPRDLALFAFIKDLIDIVVSNLDLQRDNNRSRDLSSLLGAFAHAAYTDESVESYQQTAQHTFDLDRAFSGSTIRRHIDELDLWEIEEMFVDINQALLNYVIESEFITEPILASYDLSNVQNLDYSDYDSEFLTDDDRWEFASLSITDPDYEFTLGLRLLKSNSQRASVLRSLLKNLISIVDVDLLVADREFTDGDVIEVCRELVSKRWAIRAKDVSDQSNEETDDSDQLSFDELDHSAFDTLQSSKVDEKELSDFEKLDQNFNSDDTSVVNNAGFKDLTPKTTLVGYSYSVEGKESIHPFYTDMDIPSDENKERQLIGKLKFKYDDRAKIESQFGNIKNTFDVATDTDKEGRKSFYFNISALFYNIYKIVNTFPAPKNGLHLDPSQKEVLNVIRHLTLGDPDQSEILRRLLEEQ